MTSSTAVMATTPSKVVSSSMVATAMITPHSPPKQQPSPSAMETTPLMEPTHLKVKTSTSLLAPAMTTLLLAKRVNISALIPAMAMAMDAISDI